MDAPLASRLAEALESWDGQPVAVRLLTQPDELVVRLSTPLPLPEPGSRRGGFGSGSATRTASGSTGARERSALERAG